MLTSGTRMTMPATCAGSRALMSFSMAMMEVYSVPWAPETSARILPGFAPLMTTTGMLVAGSTPAGALREPEAFLAGRAGGGAAGKEGWVVGGDGKKKWGKVG